MEVREGLLKGAFIPSLEEVWGQARGGRRALRGGNYVSQDEGLNTNP